MTFLLQPNTLLSYADDTTLNHGEIEKFSTFNFIGIIRDENIHWKPHIETVACKLANTAVCSRN